MGWKWSVGFLGSAQITGNQMGATHPPFNLLDLASNPSIQRYLGFIILWIIQNWHQFEIQSQKDATGSTTWHYEVWIWATLEPDDFIYVLFKLVMKSICAKDKSVCVFNQSLPAVCSKWYLCRRMELHFNSASDITTAVLETGVDENHTCLARQSN